MKVQCKVMLIWGEMWAISENWWVLYLLILSAIETILSFTKQDLPLKNVNNKVLICAA